MCADAASCEITTADIAGCAREVERVAANAGNGDDGPGFDADEGMVDVGVWAQLKNVILQLEELVHDLPLEVDHRMGDTRRYTAKGGALRSLLARVNKAHPDGRCLLCPPSPLRPAPRVFAADLTAPHTLPRRRVLRGSRRRTSC